jgi:hypothetical protein
VEAAEQFAGRHPETGGGSHAGCYSTNLLRVVDRELAAHPKQRFRNVTEIQAELSSAQEDSDAIMIAAPLSKSV